MDEAWLPETCRGRTKATTRLEYGGWKQIVRTAVEEGVEAELKALTAVKEEVLEVCCNKVLKSSHNLL